jgi:hypothetical protein
MRDGNRALHVGEQLQAVPTGGGSPAQGGSETALNGFVLAARIYPRLPAVTDCETRSPRPGDGTAGQSAPLPHSACLRWGHGIGNHCDERSRNG